MGVEEWRTPPPSAHISDATGRAPRALRAGQLPAGGGSKVKGVPALGVPALGSSSQPVGDAGVAWRRDRPPAEPSVHPPLRHAAALPALDTHHQVHLALRSTHQVDDPALVLPQREPVIRNP